jgi:hypothetical protein
MSRSLTIPLLLVVFCLASGSACPAANDPAVPDLKELLKARLEVAQEGMRVAEKELQAGRASVKDTFVWSRRLLEAQLAVSEKKAERVAAHEAYLQRAKAVEEMAKALFDAGRVTVKDYLEAKFDRLEAEIGLKRAAGK